MRGLHVRRAGWLVACLLITACEGKSTSKPAWISLPLAMADGDVAKLIGVDSGLCLSVGGKGYSDRDPLELAACTDETRQQFRLTYKSAGHFQLVNVGANKCVDVDMASMDPRANVFQWSCGDSNNQQISIKNFGSLAQLQMRHSGLCLDADHAGKEPGTRLIQWPCSGGLNQLFYLLPAQPPEPRR